MKKKGFTLIELLAVIVILAIITVIAVPKILNVIEKAKESSAESSIKLAKDAIKTQIASANALGNSPFVKNADNCYEFDFDNQKAGNAKELKLKNKEQLSGSTIYCAGKFNDSDLKFNNIDINNESNDSYDLDSFKSSEYVVKKSTIFNYTGKYEIYTAPQNGFYRIELWGASGGANKFGRGENYLNNQGRGAYTTGVTYLKKDTKLYVYVGQKGANGISTANTLNSTSFNGGGAGMGSSDSDDGGGAGGGATDIRLVSGDWNNFDSLKSRIMVAGGGAGGATVSATFSKISAGSGGLTGVGNSWYYPETEDQNSNLNATQTSGYGFGIGENAVTAGKSGGSGAGGGYYGGFKSNNSPAGGAGGGSSYVSGFNGCNSIAKESTKSNIIHTGNSKHYSGMYFVDTNIIDGISIMPSWKENVDIIGNKENGYAKISLLKKGTSTSSKREYLYKDGTTYSNFSRVHSFYTFAEKDKYIYTENCGIKFDNKIDLTNYSSINFEIENARVANDDRAETRIYVMDKVDVDADCKENPYCVSDKSTNELKVISVDISDLKGEYFIYQNDYSSLGTKIYRVWLE